MIIVPIVESAKTARNDSPNLGSVYLLTVLLLVAYCVMKAFGIDVLSILPKAALLVALFINYVSGTFLILAFKSSHPDKSFIPLYVAKNAIFFLLLMFSGTLN